MTKKRAFPSETFCTYKSTETIFGYFIVDSQNRPFHPLISAITCILNFAYFAIYFIFRRILKTQHHLKSKRLVNGIVLATIF